MTSDEKDSLYQGASFLLGEIYTRIDTLAELIAEEEKTYVEYVKAKVNLQKQKKLIADLTGARENLLALVEPSEEMAKK